MHHVTLLTGHTRHSPRSEVRDDVIEVMTPWLAPGNHPLPVPGGYLLESCERRHPGWIGLVSQASLPIAVIGVAADEREAEAVWKELCDHHRTCYESNPVARRPVAPWVAVALLATAPATMDWLGDFERCLAWTYLARR